jgi:hypothetical protein
MVTTMDEQRAKDWETWAMALIVRELDRREAVVIEAAGRALGQIRKQLRDEFAEQLGQLRAELTAQRAAERADIVTLPRLPLRRRGDAA